MEVEQKLVKPPKPIVVTINPNNNGRSQFVPQLFASLAATVGAFCLGTALGWSSPALPNLGSSDLFNNLTTEDKSWIASVTTLGALVSCPIGGILAEKFGRKRTMILFSLPFLLSWLLIIFAQNILMLKFGRFFVGLCGGTFSVTVPMYISEISEPSIRGRLASYFQLMITIGILFSFIAGSWTSWQMLSIICSTFPIFFLSLMIFMPESPRYLLEKGRICEASKKLCWLRNAGISLTVDPEMRQIQASIAQQRLSQPQQPFLLLCSLKVLKPTGICLLLMIFQQLSGINAITFYTVSIFQEAGSAMSGNLATIIVGAVQVLATLASSYLIDRIGRKILLIGSELGMAGALLMISLYFWGKAGGGNANIIRISTWGWVPLFGLCIFIVSFAIGLGPIPWVIMSEILPQNAKGLTTALSAMFSWLLAFFVTFYFATLKESIGMAACYAIFAGFSLVGSIFVFFCIEETNGRSLDEIQKSFSKV